MSTKNLNKRERERVSQFVGVTGAASRAAIECLQVSNWSLEPAVDYYYSSGMAQNATPAAPRIDPSALRQLFHKYKDEDSDVILAEGIMQLCEDLGVEPEDIVMLILSWHFGAQSMGEFSQQEFEGGLEKIGVDSLEKLKAKIPRLRAELDDPESYREIYNFAYMFSREKGQKCVQLDTALAMWQLVVSPERWPLMEEWCQFLKEHHKRAVSKDTWSQLLDFIRNIHEDFSNYDENGAWPYLIDEFVGWKKEHDARNGVDGNKY